MRWELTKKMLFLALLMLLVSGSVVIFLAARHEGEKRERFAAENARVLDFQKEEHALPSPLFPVDEEDFYRTGDILPASGAEISTVEILPEEKTAHGEILRMKLTGRGTFHQVTAIFDIMNKNRQWISAELRRLERKDGALDFEIELAAYRSRGHL